MFKREVVYNFLLRTGFEVILRYWNTRSVFINNVVNGLYAVVN